jgi:hypothetical protein
VARRQCCHKDDLCFCFNTTPKVEFLITNSYYYNELIFLRCLECLLSTWAPPFPLYKFLSIKELCFAIICEFKSSGLKPDRQRLGPGALPRPVEAQYQDEFYRACYALRIYTFLQSGQGRERMVAWTFWSSFRNGLLSVSGMEIGLMSTSLGFRQVAGTIDGLTQEISRNTSFWIFGRPNLGREEVRYNLIYSLVFGY